MNSINSSITAYTPGSPPPRKALINYFANGGQEGFALAAVRIAGPGRQFEQVFGKDITIDDVLDTLNERLDALMYDAIGKDLVIDRWEYFGMYLWMIRAVPRVTKTVDNQLLLDHSLFHRYVLAAANTLGIKLQIYVTKTYYDENDYYLAAEEIDLRVDSSQFFGVETDVIGFHYNDFSTDSNNGEDFYEAKLYYEKLFFNYIISYRFSDACDVFLKLIDLESTNSETAVSIKNRTPERLRWIMYVLGTPPKEPGMMVMKNNVMMAIKELGQTNSLSEMKSRIIEVFLIIEEDYCGESDQAISTFDKIVEFINANYADINLNSTMICDNFSITPAYLSRLFRRHTGASMVDFIHGVRISHLKELLLSSSETIGSLGPKCGYTSLWTMSRAFKKYEGITPSEYRSKIEK